MAFFQPHQHFTYLNTHRLKTVSCPLPYASVFCQHFKVHIWLVLRARVFQHLCVCVNAMDGCVHWYRVKKKAMCSYNCMAYCCPWETWNNSDWTHFCIQTCTQQHDFFFSKCLNLNTVLKTEINLICFVQQSAGKILSDPAVQPVQIYGKVTMVTVFLLRLFKSWLQSKLLLLVFS